MTTEQQLRRLTEVDSEHFEGLPGGSLIFEKGGVFVGTLMLEGGNLQGWEALGFMWSAMQDRWHELMAFSCSLIGQEAREFCALVDLMTEEGSGITPTLILSTYVAWREAVNQ
jgi:hypothetical protein